MPTIPTAEDEALVREKQDQAIRYLRTADYDCWMIYVREASDRVTTAIVTGADYIVQNAAFLFLRGGERIAVLQPIDVQNKAGLFFDKVVPAGVDIDATIAKTIADLGPSKIAVNYSRTEFCADGLSYGMYLRLADLLRSVGYQDRLTSAENLVVGLRAIKTQEELARMRKAAEITHLAAHDATAFLNAGVTQKQMTDFIKSRAAHYGASDLHANIAANPRGENDKSNRTRPIEPGDVLCSDMGASYKHYEADLKRCWYVLRDGEHDLPEALAGQWQACRATLDYSVKAIRAGRPGWEVHEEVWAHFESQGFKRDRHSYGHQIGRTAHDAGPWLGERTNPYRPAEARLEENMVVTLDPTINRVGQDNPDAYSMGMEEMGIVGKDGGTFVHPPQEEIYRVRL
ncbi:MAG: aminopeptidase P family protein [Armatimonadetes bacterium]|nr:aminopeptidase P family protein [Armatimonadota bacterium]